MRLGSGMRGWTIGSAAAVLALGACGADDSSTTGPGVSATLLSAPPGLASTSSTGGDTGPGTTEEASAGGSGGARTSVPAGGTGTERTGSTGPSSGAATPASSTSSAPTTPPTEPTGVPGGNSTLAMCRDYAAVVGSQSVLTIAGAFGGLDDVALARLELIAAPAVVASAEALVGEWPPALASEQAVVESSVVGPIVARAEQALGAVRAAGIDEDELETAWRTTLAIYDPADPVVPVRGIASGSDASLTAAASAFAAGTVRYDQDVSVRRTAATPLTTQFLFDQCPELSYLITGDAD